jgi:hypothetical protein
MVISCPRFPERTIAGTRSSDVMKTTAEGSSIFWFVRCLSDGSTWNPCKHSAETAQSNELSAKTTIVIQFNSRISKLKIF